MKHFDFLVAAFAWRRLQTPTSPLYNLDFRRRIPVQANVALESNRGVAQ